MNRAIGVVIFLAACGKGRAPVAPVDDAVAPSTTASTTASATASATTGEASAAASAASSVAPASSVQVGSGSCAKDADCVLTSYQEGCCVGACADYATSKKDLAARQAKENCAAYRSKPCPRPAPCPPPKTRAVRALCTDGKKCAAIVVPVPPGSPTDL